MDQDILVKKHLDSIESRLEELGMLNNMQLNDYKKNIIAQRFSERTLHIMIDEMVNTAETIIDGKKLRKPTSHNGAFTVLFEHKIIPENFHQTAKDIADFGNRLAHDYKDISADTTFTVIKNGQNDVKLFVRLIKKWLNADSIIEQFT
ncbi:MAG: DUF86 domain-containing protein [Victivallaceae bacterium]|nr:DUF86 domain-containing protein [Victivallaceae bacterium]